MENTIIKTTKNGNKIEFLRLGSMWKINKQFAVNSGMNNLFYRTPQICVKAWNDYATKNPIID